ncbi:MAG: hypothetical protein DHS20C16_32240 [Phycisphaerae bacterium]|nr:MAG: hypothetical protein DHS20C16_32240 [Phycisphaerae bacterium]
MYRFDGQVIASWSQIIGWRIDRIGSEDAREKGVVVLKQRRGIKTTQTITFPMAISTTSDIGVNPLSTFRTNT